MGIVANKLPKAQSKALGTFLDKEDVEALETLFDIDRAVLKHVKLDDGREWDTFQFTMTYQPNGSAQGAIGTFSLPVGAPNSRTTINRQHVLTLVKTFGGLQGVALTSSEYEYEYTEETADAMHPIGSKESRKSYWLVDADGDTILPPAV